MTSRTSELDTDEPTNKLQHFLDSLVEDKSTTQAYEASASSSSASSSTVMAFLRFLPARTAPSLCFMSSPPLFLHCTAPATLTEAQLTASSKPTSQYNCNFPPGASSADISDHWSFYLLLLSGRHSPLSRLYRHSCNCSLSIMYPRNSSTIARVMHPMQQTRCQVSVQTVHMLLIVLCMLQRITDVMHVRGRMQFTQALLSSNREVDRRASPF
jgi:hypothetical protein